MLLTPQIQALVDEGLTKREIARRLGVSERTLWTYLKRHGLKTRFSVPVAQTRWGET